MQTLKSAFAAAAIGSTVLCCLPVARAAVITEDFTITAGPTSLPHGLRVDFPSTAFAQFNPANGTLVDLTTTLTGSGVWTSPASSPTLAAGVVWDNDGFLTNAQNSQFSTPGTITFDLTGTVPNDIALNSFFTGTGTISLNLQLFAAFTPPSEGLFDTFQTSGMLLGSITYDFTPAAVSEPGSLALLSAELGGLALIALSRLAPRRRLFLS